MTKRAITIPPFEDAPLQKCLANLYFAAFSTIRTTIGLQNLQNLSSPSHIFASFFKSGKLLDRDDFDIGFYRSQHILNASECA